MSLRSGDQLDHYRIEARVAETPTATIYKGRDLETDMAVALKVPHGEAEADILFYDRFQREAAIGRELSHPNIPRVLPDARHSRVYFAMEWIDGITLRELLIRNGRLSVNQSVEIALAICDVLAYIHKNEVVHRDLKPENVVICRDNTVKLIDFGIAAKAGARRLTFGKLSQVMGTADYISPEQVQGKRGDARSDLYALGIMFYEMLTGEAPFDGANPMAAMNARLICEPAPLEMDDADAAQTWNPILQKLLQRDPKLRYQTASDLARDLKAPQDAQPVSRKSSPLKNRKALLWSSLALLPASVFWLMLYVARHQ